jgi:periplasmic protein TonB
MILTMDGFERDGGFEALLGDVLRERANPVVPAGLGERVLSAVAVEGTHVPEAGHGAPDSVLVPMFGTVDRVRGGRSAGTTGFAVLAHLAALLLIGVLVRSGVRLSAPVKVVTLADLSVPVSPPKAKVMGGGGGQKGPTPVTKGTPPKFAEVQIVPPKAPPMVAAKISVEPTIEVQKDVKMASSLPQIGVANSPIVGMSMGNGSGSGLGGGNGSGLGVGSGGNTGGGPRRIGGGVSAPVLLYSVEPEFSEEARKAKVAGNVLVNIWVDAQGVPIRARVLKGVGMGLDEKAVAAVKQYRFKPAMEGGKPVMVEMNVEVTFQIF